MGMLNLHVKLLETHVLRVRVRITAMRRIRTMTMAKTMVRNTVVLIVVMKTTTTMGVPV
jgi:hypothetical protein